MDCGGKRSATPLFARKKSLVQYYKIRPPESAVVAAL